MTVIIAGSRSIVDYTAVERAIERSGFEITEVVSGNAPGVDRLGERWAREREIPVKVFPAAWDTHGRRAGFLRNRAMAGYAADRKGGLIAIWDGSSKGTAYMIQIAKEHGLRVYVSSPVLLEAGSP